MTHCVACEQNARWTVKACGLPGMPWPEVPVCGDHTPPGAAAVAIVALTCLGVPFQPGETIPARALREVDPDGHPVKPADWWAPFPPSRFDGCPVRGSKDGSALLAVTGGVRVWREKNDALRYERRGPGGFLSISVHDLTHA